MKCYCGSPLIRPLLVEEVLPWVKPEHRGEIFEVETLLWYTSPPGHEHDDNCKKRTYVCELGHETILSLIPKCPAEGCDWRGKERCFCSTRVEEWPETKDGSR